MVGLEKWVRTESFFGNNFCFECKTRSKIVFLRLYTWKFTRMKKKYTPKDLAKPILEDFQAEYRIDENVLRGKRAGVVRQAEVAAKFSPAWVVANAKDTPGFTLELIDRIRVGVKKADWKQLIQNIGSTEVDFEHILPVSISSMQKKAVYSRETSERIYEVARLYGFGFEVFDSKDAFRAWLVTPSRALGNKAPFDLLDSSMGFNLVENELVRIQHNVYG